MDSQNKSRVVVLKTSTQTILDTYRRIMSLADYQKCISNNTDTLIKLNLSWTKFFPACSSAPWQVEGVIKTLVEDGFSAERLWPVENKTVVTNPIKGAQNNKWVSVLKKYGLNFTPLPNVEWVKYKFKNKLLRTDQIFPEGIEIPKMFVGKNIIHLPTLKTHGHSQTTGSIKNAFGGLLKEERHYAHKYIHEVLVDLVIMQKELHPGIFTVMDGTVCGDGAGPRTMVPKVQNFILASADPVAIDSVAAKMMGYNPMEIPYIRTCDEMGLGIGNPDNIQILGENIDNVNFGFTTKKSLVIWGDQMLRKGFLRFLEKPLLRSPLVVWAPLASNLYHDFLWYPTIGRNRIRKFMKTDWGRLFRSYD